MPREKRLRERYRTWGIVLGNLASEQPTGAQKGLMEVRKNWGDYHSSTREGQQELDRVLLVFSTYLYKEKY